MENPTVDWRNCHATASPIYAVCAGTPNRSCL